MESDVTATASRLARKQKPANVRLVFVRQFRVSLNCSISKPQQRSAICRLLTECYRMPTALRWNPMRRQHRCSCTAVKRLQLYADAQADLSCSYEPLSWRKLDELNSPIVGPLRPIHGFSRRFLPNAIVKEMKLGVPKVNPIRCATQEFFEGCGGGRAMMRWITSSALQTVGGHDTDPNKIEEIRVLATRSNRSWPASIRC